MNDKYTLRDFLVYFSTGIYLLLTVLYEFKLTFLKFFSISQIDILENKTITIFLLIPTLYLIGQIIHGIDLVFFKIGRFIWDLKVYWDKRNFWFASILITLLNFIFNGHRISGNLNRLYVPTKDFWIMASNLQLKDIYSKVEYWNIMNDLFKGLTLISIFWIMYYSIHYSFNNRLFYIVISLIFWYRARHMAVNFISSTRNIYTLENNQ